MDLELGLPLLGQKQTSPEIMASHLQIGRDVEVVDHDGLSFVQGVIQDVRIAEDMVVVQPTSDVFAGKSILVERRRVRPASCAISYSFTGHQGPSDKFRIYDTVNVLIDGKWLVGVIVHAPTVNNDSYRVRIFREEGLTVLVRTKMRHHLEWDNISDWTRGVSKFELERLQTSNQSVVGLVTSNQSVVGLVGSHRAKVLQYLGDHHLLVEYMDLTRADGTHAKEVINRKKWHKSIWEKRWKDMTSWITAEDDAVQEFGCYMPAYVCLSILGLVSPILFTDSAQSWPDTLVPLFYSLGGSSFFLCLSVLIGLMYKQPQRRTQLIKWRLICLVAVATAVVFLAIHAFYGRKDFVSSRKSSTPIAQ